MTKPSMQCDQFLSFLLYKIVIVKAWEWMSFESIEDKALVDYRTLVKSA